MYKNWGKRLIDFFTAAILLIALLPLIVLMTLILAVVNRGSPFFVQKRAGLHGTSFQVIKFKTMSDLFDQHGNPLPDDQRLTTVGKWIRDTSFDELPQLVNVLMGDMSLVGPRPLLTSYLPVYSVEQRRRHDVRPGITGWAQVNGRNAISWTKKFEFDVWYVDNLSFSLDVLILALTLVRVIRAKDITKPGMATTEKFNGGN